MKAIVLNGYGGRDVLSLQDIEKPKADKDQLLVKVHATALNRADILQRKGKYPPQPGESEILGLEIAGVVEQVGENVDTYKPGDRVFGLVGGGGYAEYCLLDHKMAMLIPDDWDSGTAAAVPEAFLTANETLIELGQLSPGESVLIHAGASGVGSAAVQLALHLNATVYFTASSAEKIAKIEALGNCHGIDYRQEDFAEAVMRLTQGQGVDVIEDFIGANYLAKNMALLKEGGRLQIIALMGGAKAELDLALLLRKRLQINGSVMRSRSLQDKRDITRRFMVHWYEHLVSGKIRPIIDSVFPLADVAKAHQRMEDNLNVGKIILTI